MWLTNVSIKRPVFITMVILALLVLGWTGQNRMPAELIPKIDLPYITVITVYPGAGPQEIETLLSEPIEEAVGSTPNLKNVTSFSLDGVSAVVLEFELGTDVNTAAADVRDKISAIRGTLPDDIQEPGITKVDFAAEPIITMSIGGNMSPRDLRILADRTVKDRLSKVKGVAAVYTSGGQEREISVAVDRDRLQAYGLSINMLTQLLAAENLNLPSGAVKEGPGGTATREYAVRTVGEFKSADEIADTRINIPGNGGPGGVIRLGDVATIQDTVKEPEEYVRLNSKDSVILAVQKQSDANTVEVADGIKEQIKLLNGYTVRKESKIKAMWKSLLSRLHSDKNHKENDIEEEKVKGVLPEGTTLTITTDQSEFVKEALSDVRRSLIEGIFLVIVIIFLFLHSTRATIIVALAIPTSIVATFLPMYFFGFSLNMMTMLALALCVGILVDDSIVVLENIERHVRKGEPPPTAALNGRSEIGLAAITITLVDVVVFVPIAFMGGIVGQFFRQFGVTIATATLFSLFMSFTLTPMLASRWLKSKKEEDDDAARSQNSLLTRLFGRFDRFYSALDVRYRGVLAWALENRALTIVIGIVTLLVVISMLPVPPGFKIFVAFLAVVLPMATVKWSPKTFPVAAGFSVLMVALALFVRFPIGGEFMPSTDRGEFSISAELPAGSGLAATNRVILQLESLLSERSDVEYYQSTVGASSSGHFGTTQGPQYGSISIKLFERGKERPQPLDDVITELSQKTALIPGAVIRISKQSSEGPGGAPIYMEITGSNMAELVRVAGSIEAAIKKVPDAIDVENSWEVGKPELQVSIDRKRAADMGMSVVQVAGALRTSIEGNSTSKLRDGGNEYDITVRLANTDRRSTSDVGNVIIGSKEGSPIYLRDVADIKLAAAPNKIDRKNRQRLITVSANTAIGASQANVQAAVNKAIKDIPTGSAQVKVGGSSEMMVESFGYLFSALLLAIALVYMLMGALFESFLTPFVIMLSLPQAMIGALLALMITGNTISIVTIIGIIMLIGLVSKNAILLIDYTNTLRERGLSRNDAVLEAGPTRLRPILMTTTAMVGGMLPTALALSKGSEMRSPMAIAVIGGLLLSTLLTLLVIPTAYTLIDDLWHAIRRTLHLKERKRELFVSPEADIHPEPVGVDNDGGSADWS